MLSTVCEKNRCTACMACVESCAVGAVSIRDEGDVAYAWIDEEKCVHCNRCFSVCPTRSLVKKEKSISWQQGWAPEAEERGKSSSGGAATALGRAVLALGGVVFGCVFRDGRFCYEAAETEAELEKFRGSKYVKSDPHGCYSAVEKVLKNGKTALFIGLPCHVAALKNYVDPELQEKLITADLICHGTPSPKVLSHYFEECKVSLAATKELLFRKKGQFQIFADGKALCARGLQDHYTFAFLKGISYTENCYSCPYACPERVSDLTLGDSWGSDLKEEEARGVSLILCQTKKGQALLEQASLSLYPVHYEKAREANRQLNHPVPLPCLRKAFFETLKKKKSFSHFVLKNFPLLYLKKTVKKYLVKLHLHLL